MTLWEYHTSKNEGELSLLGRQGWELVAVLPGGVPAKVTGEGPTFYFKRPALSFREEVTQDQKRRYYDLIGIQMSPQNDEHQP